jgi:hypothetical protein
MVALVSVVDSTKECSGFMFSLAAEIWIKNVQICFKCTDFKTLMKFCVWHE